jgi:hypothetical protein
LKQLQKKPKDKGQSTSLPLAEYPSTASLIDAIFKIHATKVIPSHAIARSKKGNGKVTLNRGVMMRISEICGTSVQNVLNWFKGYPNTNSTPNRQFYDGLLEVLSQPMDSFKAKKTGRKKGWKKVQPTELR